MRHHRLLSRVLPIVTTCGEPESKNGAILATVTYGSYEPACIRVIARDTKGNHLEGVEQEQVGRLLLCACPHNLGLPGRWSRPSCCGRSLWLNTLLETDIAWLKQGGRQNRLVKVVVVRQLDWSRILTIEVAVHDASVTDACSGNVIETNGSEPTEVLFEGLRPVDLEIKAQNEDKDGYAHKPQDVAGTDCTDARWKMHPGMHEACSETADYDCDGQTGCSDSNCLNRACADDSACTLDDRCVPEAESELNAGVLPSGANRPISAVTPRSCMRPSMSEGVFTQEP